MKKSFTTLLALIVSALFALPVCAQENVDSSFSAQALAEAAMKAPETPAVVELPEAEDEEDEDKWNWEFTVQSGFWANQWGATGGVQEYGVAGGWDSFGDKGNSPGYFNIDNTGFHLYELYAAGSREYKLNCDWKFLVQADFLYGTDARLYQSGNRFDYMALSKGQYGLAIPQLYAGIGTDKFKVIVGKFTCPVDNPGDAFFFSTSYNPWPYTHMGALATWDPCDDLSLSCGWMHGWDEAFDPDSDSSLVWFGVGKQLTRAIKLSYMMYAGNMAGYENTYSHCIVLETKLSDKLTYYLEYDFMSLVNGDDPNSKTWGLNNSLIYEINEKVQAGLRVEYTEALVADEVVGRFEMTLGYSISPFKDCKPRHKRSCLSSCRVMSGELVIRPEIRYDNWSGADGFNNETKSYQFSGGIALDYSF
ncbi:MAG: outer membrane beta-barrel protein [Thermoguttaceae bacterium]|nr:outer membrane beta-barrel protein [Thermoguttaceae bacterium]